MSVADKTFKCLNPSGIQDKVELYPLAPRLETLDGKTILLSQASGGEAEILIPLRKRLASDYPNINWKMETASAAGAIPEEEIKSVDAVIRAVVW